MISGVVLCVLILSGSQSDVTLSRAVRTGDTLVVSLGDADPQGKYANINSTLLREGDVLAKIVDNSYITHPVTVRHLFRVFGDPTAVNVNARGQAQWMAVIDLVNPLSGNPPPMALGNGVLQLSSDKFNAMHTVKTTIIAGTGTPHPFITKNEPSYLGLDKMAFVRPAKQALVSVNGTLPADVKLAGAEYRFSIPAVHSTDFFGDRIEAVTPAKLTSGAPMYFEFGRTEQEAPVGTDVLVMMTSTEGVDAEHLSAFDFVMTSDLEEIASVPNYWKNKLVGATFYDTDGQEIAGLTALVGQNR